MLYILLKLDYQRLLNFGQAEPPIKTCLQLVFVKSTLSKNRIIFPP